MTSAIKKGSLKDPTKCSRTSLTYLGKSRDIYDDDRLLLYNAILCTRADSPHSHVILHEWIAFYSMFLISTKVVCLQWLVPHETAAVFAQILCMPYNHAPCHFMQSHIRKVYACSAVTCHLHFWQNDQDLLHATAVTHG